MLRAVKATIYLNPQQQEHLAKSFGCCRWFWNYVLALTNKTYLETGKGLSTRQIQGRLLPKLKKEYECLTESDSQYLQILALNISGSLMDFLEIRQKYPRFKSKHNKRSITYPQNDNIEGNYFKLRKICDRANAGGKARVERNRFFISSKTCKKCLYQIGEMLLKIRSWICPIWRRVHDRDINAAKNIRYVGLRILASGTGVSASCPDVRPLAWT